MTWFGVAALALVPVISRDNAQSSVDISRSIRWAPTPYSQSERQKGTPHLPSFLCHMKLVVYEYVEAVLPRSDDVESPVSSRIADSKVDAQPAANARWPLGNGLACKMSAVPAVDADDQIIVCPRILTAVCMESLAGNKRMAAGAINIAVDQVMTLTDRVVYEVPFPVVAGTIVVWPMPPMEAVVVCLANYESVPAPSVNVSNNNWY